MLEYHYMRKQCAVCPKKFAPARPWQRFCSETCQQRAAAGRRDTTVRTEVRFASRADLALVRRAADRSRASSMNAWIVETLLQAARSDRR